MLYFPVKDVLKNPNLKQTKKPYSELKRDELSFCWNK